MAAPDAIESRSRQFYDRVAPDYDRTLDTPASRGMRRCFWECAEAVLPAKAVLLDFGAGSGIDAEHFANAGHRVTAYEPSDGMMGVLRARCAGQIARGDVVAIGGPIEAARDALGHAAPFDAIICNFAVFSMIERLVPVFGLFAEITRPGSTVLAAIQNPWYPGDIRTLGFWRALAASPLRGGMRYRSADLGETYRHTPAQVRRAAARAFVPDRRPEPGCSRLQFGRRSRMRLIALRRA